jgi:hypothetical protein
LELSTHKLETTARSLDTQQESQVPAMTTATTEKPKSAAATKPAAKTADKAATPAKTKSVSKPWSAKSRQTGTVQTFGRVEDLGISNDSEPEYKWATVCEAHGTFVLSKNVVAVKGVQPLDYCDECRAAVKAKETEAKAAEKKKLDAAAAKAKAAPAAK